MSRIAYLEPVGGLSGDMFLGALVSVGLPLDYLRGVVAALGLEGVEIMVQAVTKNGIGATHLEVHAPPGQPHRHLSDLSAIIAAAHIAEEVKQVAIGALTLLAEAEAHVHRATVEEVHFHEVGAVDTIVDIVGAIAGLRELGITDIYSAPLPWSQGTVKTEHGILPVPPPAVAHLLEGVPVVGVAVQGEMVTPTGAVLARTLVKNFAPLPAATIIGIGYGAGRRDWPDRPNVLRLVLADSADADGLTVETLTVLSCNIDDMNPQWYAPMTQALFDAHALDVWTTPAQMKKGRPATIVEVLCSSAAAPALRAILLRHTTTLGIRQQTVERYSVARRIETVDTPFGTVRVKIGHLPDGTLKAAPEHDDCVARATERGVSVREVWLAALRNVQDA